MTGRDVRLMRSPRWTPAQRSGDFHPVVFDLPDVSPEDVRRHLQQLEAAGSRAMGQYCVVHKHDSWVPIEIHHVHPLGDGGRNVASNRVPLCANGHSSVHFYLDELRKGYVPWVHARRFGPQVRALAERGWAEIVASRT